MQAARLSLPVPERFTALSYPIRWRIVAPLGPERDASITDAARTEDSEDLVGIGVLGICHPSDQPLPHDGYP